MSQALAWDGDTSGPLFNCLPSMVWLALKCRNSSPTMLLGDPRLLLWSAHSLGMAT